MSKMEKVSSKVGFIGSGNMSYAMMKGLVKSGVLPAAQIIGSAKSETTVEKVRALGAEATLNNEEVCEKSDVVVLGVKPFVIQSVLKEVGNRLSKDKLVVSIAAGISVADIEGELPPEARVIRVMPNTPCAVGESASGYCKGTYATEKDMKFVGKLLDSFGYALPCFEKDMNAVIGVSGSGPAYVFILIEALADGGVRCGLKRDTALKLAAQMVKGAAQMVLETGEHPGVLKDQVCSPGGTTIAAVEALEKGNFRSTLISAVRASKERADALEKK